MAGSEGPAPDPPEIPRMLDLYLQCQEWGCLLRAGGLMEQPYLLWTYIQTAGAAYREAKLAEAKLLAALENMQKAPIPKPPKPRSGTRRHAT
jgi:hypothetical protein